MIHEFILFTNMITQQLFTIAYLLQKIVSAQRFLLN